MYSLLSQLTGQPIISLQTGQAVALVNQPILEISTLEIVALLCQSSRARRLLLMPSDIRQYAPDCLIIDDEDALTDPSDIVRFTANMSTHYSPIGQPVVTDSDHKLGIVSDYTINLDTNRVQKLHVYKSLFQAWFGSSLLIDRSQILDITPERITVRDATATGPLLSSDSLPEV